MVNDQRATSIKIEELLFNLSNKKRQIRLVERQIWRSHAMMLYIGRNVLVMGMGRLQSEIIGMGLRIIPIQLFIISENAIAVMPDKRLRGEIEGFGNF